MKPSDRKVSIYSSYINWTMEFGIDIIKCFFIFGYSALIAPFFTCGLHMAALVLKNSLH